MDVKELAGELKELVEQILDLMKRNKFDQSSTSGKTLWEDMVARAIVLHNAVKPKHHKYMIRNHGCLPSDPEFYNHIHSVQDLLKFIDDPHANDDPVDQTIGKEVELRVYSRRWGHDDIYKLTRTKDGWLLKALSCTGACDKSGKPCLYDQLDHDSINYPEDLPGYLDWLWEQAAERGISQEELQDEVSALGQWISICEKNSPKGIWEGFK